MREIAGACMYLGRVSQEILGLYWPTIKIGWSLHLIFIFKSSIPWVSQFSWYFIFILIWGQGVTIFKELSVAVALSAGSPILIAFQLFLNPCQLRAGILCKNTSIVSIEVFGHNILENDLSAHVFTLTILSHHFRNWKLRYIIPSAGPLSRME